MIYAKKSLGQNFLKSPEILNKIIETANLKKEDVVLEIGPGKGSLTEKLLENSDFVIAVEKDSHLIDFLKEKFTQKIKGGELTLIYNDILTLDIKSIITKKISNYKVTANIPYYITGKLIRKFLSSDFQPSQIVLMLQKEVANRIVGEEKNKKHKESILSLSVKVYGNPEYIKTVSAKYFLPQPKVDSAILLIDNINKDFFKNIDEEKFFILIKKAFSSKRKTLLNNLVSLPIGKAPLEVLTKEKLTYILEKSNISPKIRAEDLSLKNWKDLYENLNI